MPVLRRTVFYVGLIENKSNGFVKLPPMLDKYEEIVKEMNSYMLNNIGDMSISKMHSHVMKCMYVIFGNDIVDLMDDDSMGRIKLHWIWKQVSIFDFHSDAEEETESQSLASRSSHC